MIIFQVCTTDVKCFCNDGFAGRDCSETSNITLLRLTTLTPGPTSSLTTETTNITNSTLTIAPYIATTVPRKHHWTGASSWPCMQLSRLMSVMAYYTIFVTLHNITLENYL